MAEKGLQRLQAESGKYHEELTVNDVIKTFCDESCWDEQIWELDWVSQNRPIFHQHFR
jgi:hypothetical protein